MGRRRGAWRRWTLVDDAALLVGVAAGLADRALAVSLGRTVPALRERRRVLGLGPGSGRPGRGPAWTGAEEFRLLGLLEQGLPDVAIARRLGRPVGGVQARARRLHVCRRTARGWTVSEVARRLGLDSHTVAWWVQEGWLTAVPTGNGRHRGPERAVVPLEVERFLADERHWHRWEPGRLTDARLRRLAESLRAGVEFIGVGEAARRLHVHQGTVNQWCRAGKLDARKHGPNWRIRADGGRLRCPEWAPRRRGPPRPPGTAAAIAAAWGQEPATAIAARLGVSDSLVHQVARRLGLPLLGRGVWRRLQAVPEGGRLKSAGEAQRG